MPPYATISNPIITRGVVYRNDLSDTGSLTTGITIRARDVTYYSDGDILTVQATSTGTGGFGSQVNISLSLSGSPITDPSLNIMVRLKTGSGNGGIGGQSGGVSINLSSGSFGSADFAVSRAGNFTVYTGSVGPNSFSNSNYIDKVDFIITTDNSIPSGSIYS